MRTQLAAVLTTGALVSSWAATPAMAAAPSNDLRSGATPVATLPFSEVVDTSDATTDADDAALNAECGAPVTNGSVWYAWTAPAGVDALVVDVSQSSFSAGALIAASDGAGGWYVVACGPGATGTTVVEGTDYQVLAFSDTPGVTGGSLSIRFTEETFPEVDLTVNPKGKVDRYGNALISGTITCRDASFSDLWVSLKQSVGRFAILGDGYTGGTCDGTAQPWEAVVVPYNGKFAGGKAASFAYAFACGNVFCSESYQEQSVRLSR